MVGWAVIVEADLHVSLGTLQLDVELAIGAGEVVALLGPNGAGKTTVLRTLAGLQRVAGGHVAIDGQRVDDPGAGQFVLPEKRPIGVVFQEYLLFPHLTLLENVAFGPRSKGMSRVLARQRAQLWLDRVSLGDLASQKPRAISGGQAQRTALARALSTEPRLLLLDEPFAALDAGTRIALRRDLRSHLALFPGATVLVTHDTLDALALADRVIILEEGAVTQAGNLDEITTRPRSSYVADLIGVNLLRGHAHGTIVELTNHQGQVICAEPTEGPVLVLIPPNAVTLHRDRPQGSARNLWCGEITGFDLMGSRVRVHVEGEVPLTAEVTPAAIAALDLIEGATVWTSVKATEVVVYLA